jgi:chromosome partitioning protein
LTHARAGPKQVVEQDRWEGLVITRRIAFINEKGGSGKTTLVANIAAHLAAHRGRRTLAIDLDPQGHLGKVLGLEVRQPKRSAIELLVDGALGRSIGGPGSATRTDEPRGLPATRTRIPNLDVVVANKALALFPAWTQTSTEESIRALQRSLGEAVERGGYDFVLIDAPPSFGPLSLSILAASDEVVVPVPLTYLALDGCAELLRTLELVRGRYGNPDLQISMVIPTFYRRTRMASEILDVLKKRFPKEIAQTVVGYHVKIDEAQSRGLAISEYAPRDRGALAMAALAEELENRSPAGAAPHTREESRTHDEQRRTSEPAPRKEI